MNKDALEINEELRKEMLKINAKSIARKVTLIKDNKQYHIVAIKEESSTSKKAFPEDKAFCLEREIEFVHSSLSVMVADAFDLYMACRESRDGTVNMAKNNYAKLLSLSAKVAKVRAEILLSYDE